MKTGPRVSVILPTYNRAGVLSRAAQSVLCQSFRDLELIVVDDGSTDDTEQLVKAFSDRRIRYIKNKVNGGGAEARNIGIAEARGELIAFQDSDDEWLPGKLERCVRVLQSRPGVEGVFSAFWQINNKRVRYMPLRTPPINPDYMANVLLWGNFIGTPTVVVHKKTLESSGGFDADMPRYQDWELFLRVARDARLYFIEEPLILSYVTDGSISMNQAANEDALLKIFYRYREQITENPVLYSLWMAKIGDAKIRNGKAIQGRNALLKALVHNPRNIKVVLQTLFALPGGQKIYVESAKLAVKLFAKNGW